MVFAFLLVLGPLILLHELGHFIAAKRGGIRVLEFGMGYPPRATRLWRGQGALRIGGARVEIPRNFRLPKDLVENSQVRATAEKIKNKWVLKTIAVAVDDGPTPTVTGLSGLEETSLYGEVTDLDPGTEYTLNWLPLGGFVRMYGEEGLTGRGSFVDSSKRWRAITLLAGPGMNILIAFVLFTATYMIGYPAAPALVQAVDADSPAQKAGMQAGDLIVAVDGETILRSEQVKPVIDQHIGQATKFTLRRGDETLVVTLVPRPVDQRPQGRGAIGIQLNTPEINQLVQYSPGEAAGLAVDDISNTFQQIVTLPARLIGGLMAPSEARVMGPVGIGQVAGAAFQQTVTTGQLFWILGLAAQISLALAITNLLPLPALDGGRLIFVLLEAIRRKRIPPEREAIVHLVGMALLLGLMVLITIQDISNPIIRN
jgi:regulator of sigma E protease